MELAPAKSLMNDIESNTSFLATVSHTGEEV